MTIQDIIDAICNAIYSEFGSSYKIYVEQINQGLQEPCFFVKCLDPAQNIQLGKVVKRTHQFSVQYFPLVQGSYSECQTAVEKLFDCLADITVVKTVSNTTVNYILHGKDLQGQFTNEILTFTVNYDVVLLEQTSYTEMGDLDVTVESK